MKKILFVGLGLIGGSMALALEGYPDVECYATTRSEVTRAEALRRGAVKAAWPTPKEAPLDQMDVVWLCLPPEACVDFVNRYGMRLAKGSLLTDVCGVKQPLRAAVNALQDRPFRYLGGHPMAGRERGGFVNATADLFRGAHYILTPDDQTDERDVALITSLVTHMGCADIVRTNPEAHDARIAYTSQLMHVMALALCENPLLMDSYGFEGGSFRGATRVAALEPDLWCELFWANKGVLKEQVDDLIRHLTDYSELLAGDDRPALLARLTESSDRKKDFDQLRGLTGAKAPMFK